MNNQELFLKSKTKVPGGVHSPVRAFKGMSMAPRFVKQANGAYFTDIEDKQFIDFCMSFGPLILGHQNEEVKGQLHQALDRGWTYGTCEPYSLDLAEFLIEKINFIDQVRFVNSGTEAVMTALRLARGVTGRSKIIKFNGCYHGHVDSMLIKAGSGLAGTAESSSKGVPNSIADDTLILELADLKIVREVFEREGEHIAALIIEPLPANNGLLIQEQSYLEGLKQLCEEFGALLIFDEVISGFRMGFGGMAEKTGINPDIVTYGKVIGGGLPVGALGARKEIMDHLAPIGGVYQAGTLSANPLAMVAGLATLKQLTSDVYQQLEEQTQKVINLLNQFAQTHANGQFADIKFYRQGSLFWSASSTTIKRACDIPATISDNFNPLFSELLNRGIYLAPSAYEVGFCSMAHDDSVIADLKKRLGL